MSKGSVKEIDSKVMKKLLKMQTTENRLLYLLWRYLPTLLTISLNFVKPKPFTTNSDSMATRTKKLS